MAKQPTPLIEVVIRDEVTAGLERARKRIERESADWFKGGGDGFGRIAGGAQLVRREFAALLGVTGIGAFLGGGLVLGIGKIAEALGGLAKESLQSRYSAEAMGTTVEVLNRLTVRGMAVGQSQAQAQQSIKGLTDGIQNMVVQGTKSSEWQRLLKGKGGQQFGRELLAAYKSGGAEDAARYMATRMQDMSLSGQRALTQMFGLGTGFKDLFRTDNRDLAKIVELSEPEARKFALAMANLNIESQNVAKTLAVAVMPMFEKMATGFSEFIRGPGREMIKDFGGWLKGLDIDWDKIAKTIIQILDGVVSFFKSMAAVLKDMDPIVQQMGGWKVIIGGFAVVLGAAGLSGWVGGLSLALTGLANVAWVVPLMVVLANTSSAETGPEEGKGKGKRLDRPGATPPGTSAPTVSPPPSITPPPSGKRAAADDDPENAAPYRVAATGWLPPPSTSQRVKANTDDLTSTAHELKTQVAALNKIAGAMPLSDESGAGNIAGFTGVLRRLGAPMGGGGGRRGGGGGGGGGGRRDRGRSTGTARPAGPVTTLADATVEDIIRERAPYLAQLKDPETRLLAAWALGQERDTTSGRADVLESLVNRAVAENNRRKANGERPKTIKQFLLDGFYGPVNKFRAANRRNPQANEGGELTQDYDKAVEAVAGGRNNVGGRNDQGQRSEVGGPGVKQIDGEWYGYHSKNKGPTKYETGTAASRAGRGVPRSQATATNPPPDQQNPPASQTATGGLVSPVSGLFVGGPRSHYGASRGRRPHSGTDWQAENGSRAVAMIGGVVTFSSNAAFTGKNYGAQIVVKGDDGIYRRYAVHGSTLVGTGRRVEQGQPIGIIAGGHLHYEEIHPTLPDGRPNRVYQEFERTGNADTSYQRGTTNPANTLQLRSGTRVTAGQPLGSPVARTASPIVWSNQAELDAIQKGREAMFTRARERNIGLKIRVRGPRGVKTTADSTGAISSPVIERSMDPTGGGRIESPA